MKKFKTIFLEEAVEFIGSLSEQARNKIFYNIDKVEGGIKSNDLLKNWRARIFGSLELSTTEFNTGYLLSGIQKPEHW